MSRKYPRKITLRMTNEMYSLLSERVTDSRKMPGLVRQIIREWLDDQEDLAGSKRHFTKSLQSHIRHLEDNLEDWFRLTIGLMSMYWERNLAEEELGQWSTISEVAERTALIDGLLAEVAADKEIRQWEREHEGWLIEDIDDDEWEDEDETLG